MSSLRRLLLRVLTLVRSGRAETELAREIEAHLQLLEDGFIARGMSADEAHRAARRAFGGVEQVKEQQRDVRGFRAMTNWWMDVKLGTRMLVRYPGLTVVSVFGMAVAIAITAGAFSIIARFLDPSVPLPEGDRLVVLLNRDLAANGTEARIVHDFVTWRAEMTTVRDISAFRSVGRNLIVPGAPPEMLRVVEMTPSGFRVARVPPLMGRPLLDDDEREGAAPVVVVGYSVWRTRFAADPQIIGRRMQLGDTAYTIVGVMPEGFAFPLMDSIWVPLRLNPSLYRRGEGPSLTVFGRLAPDATLGTAQAELSALGERAAAMFAATHEHLRPRIFPYPYPFTDMDEPESKLTMRVMQFAATLLLIVVCVNVAVLIYARTAMRQGEIAVRTALGASRRRVVAQLFAEALVLALAAAGIGLAILVIGFRQLDAALAQLGAPLPFWMSVGVSWATVVSVLVLTGLAAGVVGILPGLQATGARVHGALQALSPGGGARMQLGRTWTLLIVGQVAFTVALLPVSLFYGWDSLRMGNLEPGFPAHEFLAANVYLDRGSAAEPDLLGREREFTARLADRQAELARRLESDPAVDVVTFAMELPGNERTAWVEVDGVPMPGKPGDYRLGEGTNLGHMVRFNRVAPEFFRALGVPILAGRAFQPGDAAPGAVAVIVNQAFVRGILGDTDVLGRHLRYVGRSGETRAETLQLGRWYEIVAVVPDVPAQTETGPAHARVYHASAPGELHPVTIALRVRGGPGEFAARLREVAAAVDVQLQLRNLGSVEEILNSERQMRWIVAAVLGAVSLAVLLLSAAGIYAMMSFTVAQRRKEIGIRAALGADPRQLLRSIFGRALRQLTTGAALGVATAVLLDVASGGELLSDKAGIVLPIVAALMVSVGLAASFVPARRGLRIDPTEALREL